MVKTTDPLKCLGKCFFYDVEKTEGFLPGTNLVEKTHVVAEAPGFYNPLLPFRLKEFLEHKRSDIKNGGLLAERTLIFVGEDYEGSLELPKGTESIEVYDLNKDRSQVIVYGHRFSRIQTESEFVPSSPVPFANELRSPDNRIEREDIIPRQKNETWD